MEKNLKNEEALKKFKKLIEEIRICMFITDSHSEAENTRPMATIDTDDDGTLWFFTQLDTNKVAEVKEDSHVHLVYSHPGKDSYIDVHGRATIVRDERLKKEKWSPIVKAWFDSPEDPNIALMKVIPEYVYYWDSETAKMVHFFQMAAAIVTGNKKLADAAEGKLEI